MDNSENEVLKLQKEKKGNKENEERVYQKQ